MEGDNCNNDIVNYNISKNDFSVKDNVFVEINGLDSCAGRALSFYIADKYESSINKFSFEGMWNDCTYKKIKQSRFLCNQNIKIKFKKDLLSHLF